MTGKEMRERPLSREETLIIQKAKLQVARHRFEEWKQRIASTDVFSPRQVVGDGIEYVMREMRIVALTANIVRSEGDRDTADALAPKIDLLGFIMEHAREGNYRPLKQYLNVIGSADLRPNRDPNPYAIPYDSPLKFTPFGQKCVELSQLIPEVRPYRG